MRMLNNMVLVKPDKAELMVRGIHTVSAPPPSTGRVLAVGQSVQGLRRDDRVIYMAYSGYTLDHEGVKVRALDAADVLAVSEQDEDEEDLDPEKVRPLGGRITLERDATDTTYKGLIHLPDSATKQVKSSTGTILRSCEGAPVEDGERVLLPIGISNPVMFGDRPVYFCYPRQLLASLDDERVSISQTDVWRPYLSEADKAVMDGKRDEGRTHAPQ